MTARNAYERRLDLCTKAYRVGIEKRDFEQWWSELAPLNKDERTLVRAAVRKVIDGYKIEVRS